MTSTVACIGFTNPSSLASIVREHGVAFHELSSTTQWTDSSDAMLFLDRAAQNARPGFRTDVLTPYKNLVALESGLAQVYLTDTSGQDIDAVTVVPNARYTVGWAAMGRVRLVAMSLDTEFFATAEDFFDSPRSALPGIESEPPPEVRQFGLPWPPPMELESFLPVDGQATATLTGTVQFTDVRTNSRTGHEFLVVRVATLFGEVDLCTPVPLDGVPAPGAIAVGTVEMVATFPPHGFPDDAVAAPASDRVSPSFREDSADAGSAADIVLSPDDIAMPDGLVLGSDGAVRTEEEHRAWQGSPASDVSTAPSVDTRQTPDAASSTSGSASASDPKANNAADNSTADSNAPRPGETRREWRARTGRA